MGENFSFIISLHRWQGNYTDCSKLFKMRKTDDGFCCAFNTVTWREEYDQSEYEDDNYNNNENGNNENYYDENYNGGEATTSTESSQETVTYPGAMKN